VLKPSSASFHVSLCVDGRVERLEESLAGGFLLLEDCVDLVIALWVTCVRVFDAGSQSAGQDSCDLRGSSGSEELLDSMHLRRWSQRWKWWDRRFALRW
jgi:hypothetical protein